MRTLSHVVGLSALAACLLSAPLAFSETETGSHGIYVDHRGDGAIELVSCGGKLCGQVVWIREGAPAEACGLAVIGNVAPVSKNVWDGGWILDPEIGEKFDVELTKLESGELQVVGYLGTKMLSETYLWKKAPENLPRCRSIKEASKR